MVLQTIGVDAGPVETVLEGHQQGSVLLGHFHVVTWTRKQKPLCHSTSGRKPPPGLNDITSDGSRSKKGVPAENV